MEKESKKKPYVAESSDVNPEDKISFDSWFTAKVAARKKVSAHHYNTLKTYFMKQGLTEHESEQDFESALKIFGY